MTRPRKDPLPHRGRPPKHAGRAVARLARQKKLDRRTWLSRFREETANYIASDAGGDLSHRETLLVDMAADLWVELSVLRLHRLQAVACGAVEHESDKYYLSLLNTFRRTLESLGLRPDRLEREVTLADYLKQHATSTTAGGNGSQAHTAPAGEALVEANDAEGTPPAEGAE